jgi:uncharacterized membrane protein
MLANVVAVTIVVLSFLSVVGTALAVYFAYRSIGQARQALAEARVACREERLQRQLARYERLMGLVNGCGW